MVDASYHRARRWGVSTGPCAIPWCPVGGNNGPSPWCQNHFFREFTYGDPLLGMPMAWEAHGFIDYVVSRSLVGCVLWPYYTTVDGYGARIRLDDGTKITPHRLTCWLAHGDPPSLEHQTRHLCPVRPERSCIQPDHLRWGTRKEDAADRKAGPDDTIGMKHGMAKLSDDLVLAVRRATGFQYEIAEKFGISQSHVSLIKRGILWSHLPWEPGTAPTIRRTRRDAGTTRS